MMNRDRGDNPKLTILPFLITAMAKALPEWPMLNATFDDDAGVITRHGSLHLGMATQTDDGPDGPGDPRRPDRSRYGSSPAKSCGSPKPRAAARRRATN